MALQIGDKWGKLEVIDVFTDLVETMHNGVRDEVATVFVELRCDCGNTKTVSRGAFPGRRQMRDCGCGTGSTGKGRITAAYIDSQTYTEIAAFADAKGATISKSIVELCRLGLAASQSVATGKAGKPRRVA